MLCDSQMLIVGNCKDYLILISRESSIGRLYMGAISYDSRA